MRRALCAAVAAAGLFTATIVPAAAAGDDMYRSAAAAKPAARPGVGWLERLNQIRRWADMPEVSENPSYSADAQAAATWLVDNDDFTHDLPASAGPSAVRGGSSNLFGSGGSGNYLPTYRAQIDGWTNSLGHGAWNLHPGLRAVGYGEAHDPAKSRLSYVSALQVHGQNMDSGPAGVHTFPADGVTDFDLTPYPSTTVNDVCNWAADRRTGPVLRVIAGLNDAAPDPNAAATVTVNGKTVPSCVMTGADYEFLRYTDALAIIPADPFPIDAAVSVNATWHGTVSWSFRTAPAPNKVRRIAGPDRTQTAIATSADTYGAGEADAVVLTRSDSYADALAGTPLAVAKDGPLLLSDPHQLSDATRAELRRVLPAGGTVYLLGGIGVLSAAVEAAVVADGYRTVRYAGVDRFHTAAIIAEAGLNAPETILVANGLDYHDALVAGAAAAHHGGAVLLTNGEAAAPATTAYLAEHTPPNAIAIGWPAMRAAHKVRYSLLGDGSGAGGVGAAVARTFFAGSTAVGIAGDGGFADALTGGAHAAANGMPLLWTGRDNVDTSLSYYMRSVPGAAVTIYGGAVAVAPAVEAALVAATTPRFSGDVG